MGDSVHLALEEDTRPRTPTMPKEFADALNRNEKARRTFEELPKSRQKEMLVYLNYIKQPETLKRNIEKTINYLLKHK